MSKGTPRSAHPRPWRRRLVLAVWLVAAAVIALRAAQIQIVQAAQWREIASGQHREAQTLPAPRGIILDREGEVSFYSVRFARPHRVLFAGTFRIEFY